MSASVSLRVIAGPSSGARYEFTERTVAIAGRSDDCHPRIEEDPARPFVSRHHCLFDVNPPGIRVRDFGSLNGTFVNGVSIGQRAHGQTPEEGARLAFAEQDLHEGDTVTLGDTVLQVAVEGVSADAVTVAEPPADPQGSAGDRRGPQLDDVLGGLLVRARRGDPDVATIADYDVVRELGRGGQGAVYLVRHRGTGELEALKLLLAEVSVQPESRAGFLREIANVMALQHPNIVGYRNHGSSGGAFFFTTEYCGGGSVHDLVRRKAGPLSVDEAVPIVVQALAGLDHAHTVVLGPDARGLVHRDIKPANILLSGAEHNPTAKLGDFGLAKAFDRAGLSGHSMTGTVAGTVTFMARKQLINYKYARPDVDVWSMAASLYWMLTCRAPRQLPAGSDPILSVLSQPAVPIRDRNPHVPPRLAAVIDATLVEKPPSEITTARAFADALRSSV